MSVAGRVPGCQAHRSLLKSRRLDEPCPLANAPVYAAGGKLGGGAKKGGGGGKYTWGSLLDPSAAAAAIDTHDPNYDSEEEAAKQASGKRSTLRDPHASHTSEIAQLHACALPDSRWVERCGMRPPRPHTAWRASGSCTPLCAAPCAPPPPRCGATHVWHAPRVPLVVRNHMAVWSTLP